MARKRRSGASENVEARGGKREFCETAAGKAGGKGSLGVRQDDINI